MKTLNLLSSIILALLFASCGRQARTSQEEGDTLKFQYASKLSVVRYKDYTVAKLANPWKEGKTLHTYILVPAGKPLPKSIPEGTVVRTPLSRSVIFTTVHCSLLMMFEQQKRIAGVADLKYIKIPYIHDEVARGHITDCGDGMSPAMEKIIELHPDALFLSPFENSGGYGKLEDLDIPIVECAEYMEATPLARAEWMRFYGVLFGCEEKADSLFHQVDSAYHSLLAKAHQSKVVCSAMLDKVTGSVWYVPGGHSTIGQMLKDAGSRYPWADDEHAGSLSLPFETVLEHAGECDVWLFRYSSQQPYSLRQLLSEHHGYSQFRAFQRREVYGCNVETSQFYEESPFRPDLLLTDFIRILHPDIPDLPPLRYYQKIHE